MKLTNRVRNASLIVAATVLSSPVFATEGVDPWTGVDFSGIDAKVAAAGLAIVGIAMAFKGIQLAKRAVRSA